MESATLRRAPLSGQVQATLVALLLAFAIAGWVLTDEQMAGMDAGPGTELGGLAWFTGVWVVMMAAMMFPSIWPVVIAFAGGQTAGARRLQAFPLSVALVAGYLIAWTGAGLAGYLLIEGVRSLDLAFLAWDAAGRYLAGATIVAAALYQLMPLKDDCLERCRDPQRFLDEHGRPGPLGVLRTGIAHGAVCVGCCWALMAVLFALGAMSLAWMAFVAALIAAEKLLPSPDAVRLGVAAVLTSLGIAVAAAPERVPELTIPGSAQAAAAMESMGMESGGSTMKGGGSSGMGSEDAMDNNRQAIGGESMDSAGRAKER